MNRRSGQTNRRTISKTKDQLAFAPQSTAMNIPSTFLDYLQEHLFDFSKELPRDKLSIAKMIWMLSNRRWQHRVYSGSLNLSKEDLRELFGGDQRFRQLNQFNRYFAKQSHKNGARSKKDNYNSGYHPMPWIRHLLDEYLASPGESDLLNDRGNVIRTAPKAIVSKDTDGCSVTKWSNDLVMNVVPVNVAEVQKIASHFQLLLDAHRHAVLPSDVDFPGVESAQKLIDSAQSVIKEASSLRFRGHLLHRYKQSGSGRLYASGTNLQNCRRLVRKAAMKGMIDYDMTCCHYDILRQMAAALSMKCPIIDHYVENKKQVRAQIAKEAEIGLDDAKSVLAMTIYGAEQSLSPRTAITNKIHKPAAKRLFSSTLYQELRAELERAVALVVANHRKRGRIVNEFGKAITSDDDKAVIAHLLQGVEAVALNAAVSVCDGPVLLLQHDGFTTSTPVQVEKLQQAVIEATLGRFRLTFEQEQLDQLLPDYSQTPWAVEVKTIKALKAKPHAGSEGIWMHPSAALVSTGYSDTDLLALLIPPAAKSSSPHWPPPDPFDL